MDVTSRSQDGRWCGAWTRVVGLLCLIVLGVSVAFPVPRAQAAPTHTPSTIRVAGSNGSAASDINDQGHVVGESYSDSGGRPFVWQNGQTTWIEPPTGLSRFDPQDINDRGEVVGASYAAVAGTQLPVYWANGTAVQLETPSRYSGIAWAINNQGLVAGTINLPGEQPSLVLWQNGALVYRSQPLLNVRPSAINEHGVVVGYLYESELSSRAFRWESDRFTLLPSPPGTNTVGATDINEQGQIVGFAEGTLPDQPQDTQAVLWQNGEVTVLPLPAGSVSAGAVAINDRGQIVGSSSCNCPRGNRAVLWQAGGVVDLGTVGTAAFSLATGINNGGQIVGRSEDAALWNPNANATVLSNGGFETDANTDGKADDWSAAALASRSSAAKRSGSVSLRLQASGNRDFGVWQPVYGVRPNAGFDVGGWVNVPRTNDQFTFTLAVAWKDKVGTELRVDTIKSWSGTTNGWDQGTKRLTSPPNTDRAVVRLSVTSLSATVYVDDVVFQAR